jgi:hypothetical protein
MTKAEWMFKRKHTRKESKWKKAEWMLERMCVPKKKKLKGSCEEAHSKGKQMRKGWMDVGKDVCAPKKKAEGILCGWIRRSVLTSLIICFQESSRFWHLQGIESDLKPYYLDCDTTDFARDNNTSVGWFVVSGKMYLLYPCKMMGGAKWTSVHRIAGFKWVITTLWCCKRA